MSDPEEALNNESSGTQPHRLSVEKRVPVAVLVLLVCNLFAGIWFAAAFYTQQNEQMRSTETHFSTLSIQMDKMEESIYTRQEAAIALDGIRQTNDRQDDDIKQLNTLFTNMLLSISQKVKDR